MIPATIIDTVQDILQASSDLSEIADGNIFQGVRENVTIFPCIVIESVGDRLLDETYPYEGRALGVNIIFFIKVFNKDNQLDEEWRIANNIRKAISADITLGLAGVYDTRLLSDVSDVIQYPVRGHAVNIEVHYRQDRLTRA